MRVLVIEDEIKVAQLIARSLASERFAIDIAEDGKSGLELATTFRYDLVILDLMLPQIDGTTILYKLRKENSEIPVLVLTAKTALSDKVDNFKAGADDYLTKPFALAELQVRVKALLRRGPVNHSSCLRIADLQLDRLSQEVARAGKRVDLSSKEFALLEYLMMNGGTVISRDMLLHHVWGQSFECITNIVPVYIGRIRAKIDDCFECKLIRTVRGVGYVLTDKPDA